MLKDYYAAEFEKQKIRGYAIAALRARSQPMVFRFARFLQNKFPEIFGVTVQKTYQINVKGPSDVASEPLSHYARGGVFKASRPYVVGERNGEHIRFQSISENRGDFREKIKSSTVISASGVNPYLLVTLDDGRQFRQSLDGPAMFNLNVKIGEALSAYLSPSKRGDV